MLEVSIRVTRTPTHLEEISNIAIQNTGAIEGDICWYKVYLKGKYMGTVEHKRSDGALALLKKALWRIEVGFIDHD